MTDRRLLTGLAPLAGLAALAVAGCGGSSSNSDASFISKVNAQCRATKAQAEAVSQPTSSSTPELTAYLKKILPINQSGGDKIRAISPPADKKADFDAANALQDQEVATVKQAIKDGDAGDGAAQKADLSKLQGLSAQSDALATKVGVSDCGSTNSSSSSTTDTTTT